MADWNFASTKSVALKQPEFGRNPADQRLALCSFQRAHSSAEYFDPTPNRKIRGV